MVGALILLGFVVLLGVVVLLGGGADTRDPEFSVGRALAPRAASDAETRYRAASSDAPVAQRIERPPSKRLVAGSIPAGGTLPAWRHPDTRLT